MGFTAEAQRAQSVFNAGVTANNMQQLAHTKNLIQKKRINKTFACIRVHLRKSFYLAVTHNKRPLRPSRLCGA